MMMPLTRTPCSLHMTRFRSSSSKAEPRPPFATCRRHSTRHETHIEENEDMTVGAIPVNLTSLHAPAPSPRRECHPRLSVPPSHSPGVQVRIRRQKKPLVNCQAARSADVVSRTSTISAPRMLAALALLRSTMLPTPVCPEPSSTT
jgi:hypothetical protein